MPGDRWEGAKDRAWATLKSLGWPYRKVQAFFDWLTSFIDGTQVSDEDVKWRSTAGQFAAALHPRARTTDATYVVQLTDRHLRVTYVQCARVQGSRLGAVQPGFVIDRARVAWLRARPDLNRGCYEFGFVDGSWARVALHAPRRRDFVDQFPLGPPR